MKIHKGDKVLVISGKDRLKEGKVVKAFPKIGKVIVEAVNLRKKHIKPKKSGEKGQVAEISLPIFVSNLKIVCPKCGVAARVGYKIEGDKKYRICKKCKGEI
jgi:large subunit ribosomal protein L24